MRLLSLQQIENDLLEILMLSSFLTYLTVTVTLTVGMVTPFSSLILMIVSKDKFLQRKMRRSRNCNVLQYSTMGLINIVLTVFLYQTAYAVFDHDVRSSVVNALCQCSVRNYEDIQSKVNFHLTEPWTLQAGHGDYFIAHSHCLS